MNLKIIILLLFIGVSSNLIFSQKEGSINIDTKNGHNIKIGSSGFNVRIADKSWNYTHPDFRKAVNELKPGWLRYFSGTMGDAFSSATGQYDMDYAMMFDHPKQYLKGYRFTEVKGPHRIIDLYHLLGEINGKLIITVNGFTETPEMTRALALFCKNNNIEVATWQFCNEPYFYVPHRERFWWNNGYDYAVKMKPHADAIKSVFPDAFLALNYTWDGIWGFMKEINQYQNEQGAYWNVFSKHSYAPHTGKKEPLLEAYKRGNTKLIEATSPAAMQEIEDYTSENVPMVITEFGVWNSPLNGIYSSIYNIEYVMRQLQHSNTWYVGAHEVSSKYSPDKNINEAIEMAYKKGEILKTDSISTGVKKRLEGKAYEIYHEATNNSDFIYSTKITNGFVASGLKNANKVGCFTQAYKGVNGYNYLVFTNRTNQSKDFKVFIDGISLNNKIEVNYIKAETLEVKNTDIQQAVFKKGKINIPAFSISVAKWKSDIGTKPVAPIIYKAEVVELGVKLTWGSTTGNIDKYEITYNENAEGINEKSVVKSNLDNTVVIDNLEKGKTYYFKITAQNKYGQSEFSNQAAITYQIPKTPEIFKTSRRDDAATIFWKSVSSAKGYKLKYVDASNKNIQIIDANNVFGYRVEGLQYNLPYEFSVAAYNDLGIGKYSKPVKLVLSDNIPFSPRNVSAVKNENGYTQVNWIAQDSIHAETTYNVYRGKELHKFEKIASNIKSTFYEDVVAVKGLNYYYTVKAETSAGESNFYPNIATVFSNDEKYSIDILGINKEDNGYLVKVEFKNILLDGEYSYGIQLNNISYLTVEEKWIVGKNMSMNSKTYDVFIPNGELSKKSKYAIKAFVNTNGKNLFSTLPDHYISID